MSKKVNLPYFPSEIQNHSKLFLARESKKGKNQIISHGKSKIPVNKRHG